jgi:hypothetical protein
MRKLGLVAGGGSLPVEIARHCERAGRPLFVIRLKGFAGDGLAAYAGAEIGLAEIGKCFKALKRAGCEAVCLAGNVARPDFGALMPDIRGLALLPAAIAAARRGDDALLRLLISEFEKEGFSVEGAHEVMDDLGLPAGPLGRHAPSEAGRADIVRALEVARAIGRLDVGQGAVVCDGLVLAVEAQEGTDAMLGRVAQLPEAIRGRPGAPRGVLAKAPKPIQETRVDLPTIGLATVEGAARAGLTGIVGEAGRLLVLDREAVVQLADELGIFILGVEAAKP